MWYFDCSRKSKKKLTAELENDAKSSSLVDDAELSVAEEDNSALLTNNFNETDDWSDTPLSALKNESADQDIKSSIEETIKAVADSEYKFDEPSTSDKEDDSGSTAQETSTSVKAEKSDDVAVEDDNSSSVKSAQTTPKAKRRSKTPSKTPRSRSAK